jgi:hypothetical protein
MQGIELAIATRSVGDFNALRLALQGHPFGGGGTPSENGDLYVQKNTLLQQS